MTLDQLIEERLPRKGLTGDWPLRPIVGRSGRMYKAPWTVLQNLHLESISRGYLTGAIFVRPESRTKKKYKLMLVNKCPWTKRSLRYYSIAISADELPLLLADLSPQESP